jgi:hypothetical protein
MLDITSFKNDSVLSSVVYPLVNTGAIENSLVFWEKQFKTRTAVQTRMKCLKHCEANCMQNSTSEIKLTS